MRGKAMISPSTASTVPAAACATRRPRSNAASEELLASRRPGDTSWKIELMQRAQADGDVTNGLVLTGQVASAIGDIISVAEFVPQMAEEAAAVLRSLCVLVGDGPAEKPRTSCS